MVRTHGGGGAHHRRRLTKGVNIVPRPENPK